MNPTIGLGLLASEARERGEAAPRRNPNLQGPSPREQGLEILRDMRERGVRFTSGLDMGMAYADFNRAPAEAWAFVAGGWAVGVAGAADHDLRHRRRHRSGRPGRPHPDWPRRRSRGIRRRSGRQHPRPRPADLRPPTRQRHRRLSAESSVPASEPRPARRSFPPHSATLPSPSVLPPSFLVIPRHSCGGRNHEAPNFVCNSTLNRPSVTPLGTSERRLRTG